MALLPRIDEVLRGMVDVAHRHPKFDEAAGRHGIQHLVQPGQLDPDHIITAGVYVKRIVALPSVAEWMAKAVQESNFLIYEEPCLQA
jgi:hypothetical protein